MNPGLRRTLPPMEGMAIEEEVPMDTPLELPVEEILEDPLDDTGQYAIPPEAVSYRDGTQICGNCEYMGADGMCEPLQIDVGPSDGCNLFKQGDAGGEFAEPV